MGLQPLSATAMILLRLVQINDVYEPAVLDPARQPGGLPRVAHYVNEARKDGVTTLLVHGGDAYSPSVFNRMDWLGAPLAGRHMNEILNAMDVALAVPGNHEFDLGEEALMARLKESRFLWLNNNLTHAATGALMAHTRPSAVLVTPPRGTAPALRVGFFGVSVGTGDPAFRATDINKAAADAVRLLQAQKADVIVALTHLMRAQDEGLARNVPGIHLIVGGHEHEGMLFDVNGITVAKAPSNARELIVHELVREADGRLHFRSRREELPTSMPEDPTIAAIALRWQGILEADLARQGIDARRQVYITPEALDGLDGDVRLGPTTLSRLVIKALQSSVAPMGVDFTLLSGGVIRIDDTIPPGPVTEYDLLRIFPFPERLLAVKLPGDMVARLLRREFNFQRLSYYSAEGATVDETTPLVAGAPVDPQRLYTVGMTKHLYRRVKAQAVGEPVDAGDLRELLGRYLSCLGALVPEPALTRPDPGQKP